MNVNQSATTLTSRCLHYVLLLRTVSAVGLLTAFISLQQALHIQLQALPFMIVAIGFIGYTFYVWRHFSRGFEVTEKDLLVQLLIEVAAIATLLFFMGGSTNPLVSLFLLPVTVAAATLPTRSTWIVMCSAAFCYTLLMFQHTALPEQLHHLHNFNMHVWGMWFGFLLSAVLVAFFVSRIGTTLRENDCALARAREEALQAEQVLKLGSLAAGTAHELGTPLATMAILAKELDNDTNESPEINNQIKLLASQVARCKDILSVMSHQAGHPRADGGYSEPLDNFLDELINDWKETRTDIKIDIEKNGVNPAPNIIVDITLRQAITNLLNNAADASPYNLRFIADWDSNQMTLEILDRGEGINKEIAARLGEPFVTSKSPGKGFGLGVYLAKSTTERLGGELVISPRKNSGTRVLLNLPLEKILN